MGQTATPREAIGLTELARRFRASAADTNDMEYIGVFLSAALALEARANGARPDMTQYDRHIHLRRVA